MKLRLLTFVLLLILLGSIVIAQEKFDYKSPASYQDPYFLQNSNPADWNPVYIDEIFSNPSIWDNPEISRFLAKSDLYTNSKFYENFDRIPLANYGSVKWEKVKLGTMDLNKIDWTDPGQFPDNFHLSLAKNPDGLNNYLCAFGNCGSIKIDNKRLDKVKFDGKGIQNGRDAYVVLKDYPPEASYEVKGIRIIVTLPTKEQLEKVKYKGAEEWREGKVPSLSEDTNAIFIFPSEFEEGVKFKLGENNVPVEGQLNYKNGEWHVQAYQTVLVNDIEIRAKEVVPIYGLSDGDLSKKYLALEDEGKLKQVYKDMGRGIFMGEDGFVIKDTEEVEAYTLDFKKGNPYIEIKEKGDGGLGFLGYGQKYNDRLEITPLKGGFIFDGDNYMAVGSVEMKNGHRELGFKDGHVYSRGVVYERDYDSVPMEIELLKEDLTKPEYAELTDVENVISISDEHKVKFGGASHLSVMIDPHKLLGLESDALEIVNNLDITAVKKPFFIVASPGHSEDDGELFDTAIKIMEGNIRGDYYPIVIKLKNEEVFVEALEQSNPDLIDPRSLFEQIKERIPTHEKFLSSLDTGELSEYEFRIIGHSTVEHTPSERFGVAVAGLEIDSKGNVIDSAVELRGSESIDKLLGCSVADEKVNQWGMDKIKNKVQTEEFKVMPAEIYLKEYLGSGSQCNIHDKQCVLDELDYDVLYDKKKDYVQALGSDAYEDVWSYVKSQSREKANSELYNVIYYKETDIRPSEIGIQNSAVPFFAALETAKINLGEEPLSDRDLMLAVEEQEIIFPDCSSARDAERLVYKSYRLRVNYGC